MVRGSGEIEIPFPKTFWYRIIGSRVSLADHRAPNRLSENVVERFCFFDTDDEFTYTPFCDDFGPENLSHIMRFIDILQAHLNRSPARDVVYCVESSPRKVTNAAFLLGSFMVLQMHMTAADVWAAFSEVDPSLVLPYRDATFRRSDFHLHLLDCWRGLERANTLGWVQAIDMDEYRHYESPLEGDLHMIVPDRLIAFRGPQSLPDDRLYDDRQGCRYFAPSFYVEPFRDMGVRAVVRLSEADYDPVEFEREGIATVDLDFGEAAVPSAEAAARFLQLMEGAGTVAVHCLAGLGRSGTLAGLYLMCAHGFGAAEAIAWVRIVRPGSVVGEQQHFLRRVEELRAASTVTVEDGLVVSASDRPAVAVPTPLTAASFLSTVDGDHSLLLPRSSGEMAAEGQGGGPSIGEGGGS